jgi:secreted trypsin-like serine protease
MKFFTVFILLLTILGLVEGNQADDLETIPGDFPWMVLVRAYNESTQGMDNVCGGSIISDMFVITAAHCFGNDYMNVTRFSIRTVINNTVNENEEAEQNHPISQIIVYNKTNSLNDLALILVSKPFNFTTESVKNISLSNLTSFENMTLVTIGWDIFNPSVTSQAAKPLEKIIVQENIECTQNQPNSQTKLCANVTDDRNYILYQ